MPVDLENIKTLFQVFNASLSYLFSINVFILFYIILFCFDITNHPGAGALLRLSMTAAQDNPRTRRGWPFRKFVNCVDSFLGTRVIRRWEPFNNTLNVFKTKD